jgi:ankyrin repeat protein
MRNIGIICRIAVSAFLVVASAPAEEATHNELTPEYFKALRGGDTPIIRELLEHGASVNARDALDNTPLMHAAVYGDLAAMRLLLDRGAEVNASNRAGATALMRSAFDSAKVSLLLDHAADVNARSALGNTALMLASRPSDSHRAVELLLAHGADTKATNNWGATSLMAAAAGGDLATAQLLLKHGAEVNAQSAADPIGFILGGGRNALMWAAYRGDISMMRLLIDAGADVNIPGFFGSPLSQAAWGDHTSATELLLKHGAKVNQADPGTGYTPLHWAASTEKNDRKLVDFLVGQGADPNLGGGADVEAFMGTLQTPLMLARRRGETPIVDALVKAGATNMTPDRVASVAPPRRDLPEQLDWTTLREAAARGVPPLQATSLESKQAFLRHASHQDCISCHQQFLPLTAVSLAKKQQVQVDQQSAEQLLHMVAGGELKDLEIDWQPLFHPEPVHTKGYALLALAAAEYPAGENTDSWVHHLAVIQGPDGQWYNNMPRPPIQTSDIGATALAIHALQRYPLPGRRAEFAARVDRARQWLWKAKPDNNEGRIYQILGLAWAGEAAGKLQPLVNTLLEQQQPDGGWAQLPGTKSDAYATGQAVYALRVGGGLVKSDAAVDRGLRYLLSNQLEDGTWYVRRRTFPFQPTMNSGFPHGRDSWISATASSWAVMALSLPERAETVALQP